MFVQQDAKVVESASLALTRCAEALSHSPHHLETLCSGGLVGSTLQLVAVSEGGSMTSQLAVPTYYGLLRLLTTCAAGCPAVAETLHRAAISATIRKLLSRQDGSSPCHDVAALPGRWCHSHFQSPFKTSLVDSCCLGPIIGDVRA